MEKCPARAGQAQFSGPEASDVRESVCLLELILKKLNPLLMVGRHVRLITEVPSRQRDDGEFDVRGRGLSDRERRPRLITLDEANIESGRDTIFRLQAINLAEVSVDPRRSGNGLVFTSRDYTRLVRSYGLKQEFITPHCPQQNGMVEQVTNTVWTVASDWAVI